MRWLVHWLECPDRVGTRQLLNPFEMHSVELDRLLWLADVYAHRHLRQLRIRRMHGDRQIVLGSAGLLDREHVLARMKRLGIDLRLHARLLALRPALRQSELDRLRRALRI